MKYKRAITYGTFDLFHIGHLKLLKRIASRAEEVIVAVSTDEFNEKKGKKSEICFQDRVEIVESIRFVSRVIPEADWSQKVSDIINMNIDLFVMGDDWEGKFDELKAYCDVVYLPRTVGVSSTKLKTDIKNS